MPCDTRLKPKQTISERAAEVRRAVDKIGQGLASGRIKARVGPQGAIAFDGVSNEDRDGVTDACIYRRLLVSGSALAKAALARAEQLAGRSIDRQSLAHGHHSHDGGRTWHNGH
jgi:hypothetical protein